MNFDTPAAQAAVARRLSANTKAERDEALEAVKAWLVKNKAPTDFEYLKVWRALFYCFWMTDKRGPQLQVAQTLSCLLHELGDVSRTLRFARAFFATMVRDWLALDKHRIDKFYTLIRGMVRQLFVFLAEHEWDADTVVPALAMLEEEVFSQRPNGPRFHLLHIWLDELLVVDRGLPTDALVLALRPVWGALLDPQHPRLVELAMNDGVLKLLRQLVAPDDDSGDEEEEASAGAVTPPPAQALPNVHGPSVGKLLFEIAADKRCDAEARDVLYMAHEGLVREEEDPAAAVSGVQAGAGFSSSVDPVAQRLMVLAGLVDEAEAEEVAAAAAAAAVPGQGDKKKAAGQRKGKKGGGAVARAQGGDTAAQRRQGSGVQRGGGPSEEEAAAAAAGVAAASARYSKATSDRASAPTTRGSKRGRAGKGPPQGEEEEGDKRVRFTRSEALSHAASVKRLRRSARQSSAGEGESAMPKPVLKAGGSSSSPEEAEGGGVTGVAAWAVEDDDTDLVGNWGVPATTPPGKKGGAGKAKSPASSKKKRKKARRQ